MNSTLKRSAANANPDAVKLRACFVHTNLCEKVRPPWNQVQYHTSSNENLSHLGRCTHQMSFLSRLTTAFCASARSAASRCSLAPRAPFSTPGRRAPLSTAARGLYSPLSRKSGWAQQQSHYLQSSPHMCKRAFYIKQLLTFYVVLGAEVQSVAALPPQHGHFEVIATLEVSMVAKDRLGRPRYETIVRHFKIDLATQRIVHEKTFLIF
eukprot:5384000-Pleurochrysis_carterae.AAC.11